MISSLTSHHPPLAMTSRQLTESAGVTSVCSQGDHLHTPWQRFATCHSWNHSTRGGHNCHHPNSCELKSRNHQLLHQWAAYRSEGDVSWNGPLIPGAVLRALGTEVGT